MESEINSIRDNKTWDRVGLQKNRRAPKYKPRLVAKGIWQQYGADFDNIFSLVVKMTILRFLLSVVAVKDLEHIQLDVKTTVLYGDLEEEI